MTGDRVKPSDELAAEVDHVPCPRCEAEAGAPCVNPIKHAPARVPCIERIRAASSDPHPTDDTVIQAEETTER